MNPDDLRERLVNQMAFLVSTSGWMYTFDDPNALWALNEGTYIEMLGDGSLTIQIAAPDYEKALSALDSVAIALDEHVDFMVDA